MNDFNKERREFWKNVYISFVNNGEETDSYYAKTIANEALEAFNKKFENNIKNEKINK